MPRVKWPMQIEFPIFNPWTLTLSTNNTQEYFSKKFQPINPKAEGRETFGFFFFWEFLNEHTTGFRELKNIVIRETLVCACYEKPSPSEVGGRDTSGLLV